jgi:tRNA(Arg) A34 adenosine deaminase TadA
MPHKDPEKAREYFRRRNAYPQNVYARRKYDKSDRGIAVKIANNRKRRGVDATRFAARDALNAAVRYGIIKRLPCEVCGDRKSHGHHHDYSKPLEVTWLCRAHHDDLHASVNIDRQIMTQVIDAAKEAATRGDYCIAAAVACGSKILAIGGNRAKTKRDSSKHVELELLQYAVGAYGNPYLPACTLFTTHQPCVMCTGAAIWTGVSRIVYGLKQEDIRDLAERDGTYRWRYILIPTEEIVQRANARIIVKQFMHSECSKLFTFQNKQLKLFHNTP